MSDMYLCVVALSSDKLGCHPVGGTDDGIALLLLLGKLGSIAEVRQLDLSLHRHQNVITLDVAVNTVKTMNIYEALKALKGGGRM